MLYDIGFFIFSIIYLPTLIFKGKLHKDFLERFGIYDEHKRKLLSSTKDKIWIEAVSVGEVALCRNLIPLLRKDFPDSDIVLSTITKTGNDLAKRLFSKNALIIYFPLDFSFVVKSVVSLIRPRLYIMVETEIWPNTLKALYARSVPSILINGRISDRSYKKYRLVKPFLRNALKCISRFCMQTQKDVERIIDMGAPRDKTMLAGSIKFDIDAVSNVKSSEEERRSLGLNPDEKLFVAGSTHSGEETIVLGSFKELVRESLKIRLLIAPRHIDRVKEVEAIVRRFGLESVRVSALAEPTVPSTLQPVLILDTIGRLNAIYRTAAVVFIGGSLVKYGGHNPIEPAILEKAVLFGPHMFNFKSIADIFLKNRGAIEIRDTEGLINTIRRLLKDDFELRVLGQKAKETVLQNRGATTRNLEAIKELMV